MDGKQILKNLHAVLVYAKERFNNEFVNQEVMLSEDFKKVFKEYINSKGRDIDFYNYTSVLTNRDNQHIYIANQWFAIASYFVDFCTELLTYQQYFGKICQKLHVTSSVAKKNFATELKNIPNIQNRDRYKRAALELLKTEFPNADEHEKIVDYLWKFASDYNWWSGSKTIDRHDFHISPILNQLNVVNANAEFLADIVLAYSSDLRLRMMVERLEDFTINIKKKEYIISNTQKEYYKEAEEITEPLINYEYRGISISAASLERFQSSSR